MRIKTIFLVTLFLLMTLLPGGVNALAYPTSSVGQDISWPNCNNLKFEASNFGIVGVNGGLNLRPNKCLGEEASLYRQNLSLYVNTGFPGSPYDLKFQSYPLNCNLDNIACMAYNYGYNSGRYATNYAYSRGVVSNNWWLDVETINSWTTNTHVNKMSLIGEANAINESVTPNVLGYYTYISDWKTLTNNWKNNFPSWVASNSNYKNVAAKECSGSEFNGGKTLLTQYIGKTDLDIAC